jgi:hypothetical protein
MLGEIYLTNDSSLPEKTYKAVIPAGLKSDADLREESL